MKSRIAKFVVSYHFNKAMTGSGFSSRERGTTSFDPLFWFSIGLLIVAINIDNSLVSGILTGVAFTSLVSSMIPLLWRTHKSTRAYRIKPGEPGSLDWTMKKSERQFEQLKKMLPDLTQEEWQLLSFITILGTKEEARRVLPNLIAAAMQSPHLSQAEFIREIAADLKLST